VTIPYYVSPEQVIADKAEFASKGIKRGRSVIVMSTESGVLFVADNPSRALHKIGEIYDRIGFAAVGKYNEFESLRVAGIRLADMRGFSYDRSDVTVRTIANAYAQTLGSIFIEASKPYEVEIAVAEVGANQESDQLYRISFDGSVHDETGYICMGGEFEKIAEAVKAEYRGGMSNQEALALAVSVLTVEPESTKDASAVKSPLGLEVALLDRTRSHRTFIRFNSNRIAEMTQ
jgi:proteasome alpha subunit